MEKRTVAALGWIVSLLTMFVSCPSASAADAFMFRARVDGKMLEGKPIHWSKHEMVLLGRDGAIHEFHPKKAKETKKTAPRFLGYSMSDMKREIYREFGKQYDVSTTRHYIVAHPRGERDLWAERFEDLYRSFSRHFRVRGFRLHEPEFPLMAVIFRNKSEYYRHAAAGGTPMQPGTLGHYDFQSNRIFLFDVTSKSTGANWSHNADTIIHEATHQAAFNVGIHTRYSGTPQWVIEGLATLFEARGIWDSRSHPSQKDRLNQSRLRRFQEYAKKRRKERSLAAFVASDRAFRSRTLDAYAEAWALSFYLNETRPRLYAEYLAKTAERPMLSAYASSERVADFQKVFGNDTKMLEVKFLRYMKELE